MIEEQNCGDNRIHEVLFIQRLNYDATISKMHENRQNVPLHFLEFLLYFPHTRNIPMGVGRIHRIFM